MPTYKFMLFSRKSHSLLLLKHFWLAVTPSVTWRTITQRLRAYLWCSSLDFALFFTKMYSWLFYAILLCPRGSSCHALTTQSLRKTQEINWKHGFVCVANCTKKFWRWILMSTCDCTENSREKCDLSLWQRITYGTIPHTGVASPANCKLIA